MEDEAPSASGGRRYPTPEEIYALSESGGWKPAHSPEKGGDLTLRCQFRITPPQTIQEAGSAFFARIQQGFERGFQTFRDRYNEFLTRTLENRKRFVTIFLTFAIASLSLFYFNGQEFFPEIKSGTLQNAYARAARNTN